MLLNSSVSKAFLAGAAEFVESFGGYIVQRWISGHSV
jgi:hypothetical protein